MKHIKFIILLIPFLTIGQTLSFSDAETELNSNNQKIKGMKKLADAASIEAEAIKGLYLPKISLNGSFVHMNDNLYLDFNKYKLPVSAFTKIPSEKLGDWKYNFQNQHITKLSADFELPIFTGGKINAAIKAEKIKADISNLEATQTKDALLVELAQRYFDTELAQQAILVRKQVLDAAKLHLNNAEKLEKNGFIAPVETMQAKVAVAEAERELLGAKKDEELARSALNGLIGKTDDTYTLTTQLFEIQDLKPLSYYQKLAKDKYPEILKAELKIGLADQNLAVQKSNFLPKIALVGKKYLFSKNLPITEPNWYVGLGININLFNGFQDQKNYEKATETKEAINLLKNQAKIDIQTLVKKYYTEILKQQEQLKSLEKSISFSEELVRVRTTAFKEGFATSTDVADANLYLASIKIKRLQALAKMDKTMVQMLQICGITNEFKNYIL